MMRLRVAIWPPHRNATQSKPFGRSRLKKPIRELIKGYVRTVANATIGQATSRAATRPLISALA